MGGNLLLIIIAIIIWRQLNKKRNKQRTKFIKLPDQTTQYGAYRAFISPTLFVPAKQTALFKRDQSVKTVLWSFKV